MNINEKRKAFEKLLARAPEDVVKFLVNASFEATETRTRKNQNR